MGEPLVLVIVLNWNGKDTTIECLHSLERQIYPNFQVVVVDNGSTDGSQAALREAFPAVILIENNSNLGFSEGNNVGVRFALEQGADYVLLINNDTIVDERMLTELVQVMASDDRIGAVGPKMYFYTAPQTLWAAGGIIHFGVNVSWMRGWNQLDTGQYGDLAEVDYIPGCGLLVRAATIEMVGLIDPDYFAYYEDVDWCWRMKQRGYRIVYVPAAKMWHKASLSLDGEYSPKVMYMRGSRSVIFMRKHAGLHQWIKFLSLTALSYLPLLLVRSLQGKGRGAMTKGKGIWDGLRRGGPGGLPRRLSQGA